jgi:hypothetical protein
MKKYEGVELYIAPIFYTSAIDGGERGYFQAPAALPPGKGPPVPIG